MTYFNAKLGILLQIADAEVLITLLRCLRYTTVVNLDKTKGYYDDGGTKPQKSSKIKRNLGAI